MREYIFSPQFSRWEFVLLSAAKVGAPQKIGKEFEKADKKKAKKS